MSKNVMLVPTRYRIHVVKIAAQLMAAAFNETWDADLTTAAAIGLAHDLLLAAGIEEGYPEQKKKSKDEDLVNAT